ncbi:hypothetical protein Q5P01_023023 [Channa striata]|uniref:Uncharacterized protein n=1 Tax=Channa striata TaxID=64152 RepID=A0AA88LS11_CHASR|nr:hypothetical protein Q5P01_023023 [Channa striata]
MVGKYHGDVRVLIICISSEQIMTDGFGDSFQSVQLIALTVLSVCEKINLLRTRNQSLMWTDWGLTLPLRTLPDEPNISDVRLDVAEYERWLTFTSG